MTEEQIKQKAKESVSSQASGTAEEMELYEKFFIDGYHEGFKDCAKARLNVTTVSDCPIKDNWHYVKDGLPEEEKEYIVYSEEWGYEIRKFLVDVGYFECRKNDEIIKWKEIE